MYINKERLWTENRNFQFEPEVTRADTKIVGIDLHLIYFHIGMLG